MVPRFPILGLALLLSFPAFAASIALGPEREIAPSTVALRFNGFGGAIGASEDGFISVWAYPQTLQMFVTLLDTEGRPVDPPGFPLPVQFFNPAVAWNGREYVVAGARTTFEFLRIGTDGTVTGPVSVASPDTLYAAHLRLTFNGRVLLLTWMTQSLGTQTLFGMILSADLDVLVPQFTIATRAAASTPASVASDGDNFLVAWENAGTLKIVNETGEVSDGASIASLLRPAVAADAGGFIALWDDRSAIYAVRVAADGTLLGSATKLVEGNDIGLAGAISNATELGAVWTVPGNVACPYHTEPNVVIFGQRFDSALHAIDDARAISDPAHETYLGGVAASSTDIVATMSTDNDCAQPPVVRAVSLDRRDDGAEAISTSMLPSLQLDVAAASDGDRVLSVWSEQRDELPSRIYAALLDDDGNVLSSPIAISEGDEGHVDPQIAYGDGRYLIAWRRGNTLTAQFVSRSGDLDGEPIGVAIATTSAELVWDGSQFVFVWADENGLRSARVSAGGFVTTAPRLNVDGTIALADVVVGADGEIAALYRVETAQRVFVRVATLRLGWNDEQTLVSERRPCSSLACIDYAPIAIGWSGTRYVAVWMKLLGAGRQSYIQASTFDGHPHDIVYVASSWPEAAGEIVWSGSSFLFAFRSRGVSASWLITHIMRIGEDGELLETSIRLPEITSDAGSAPDLALVRPGRAVVVYNTLRAVARSVVINPRRRAVR